MGKTSKMIIMVGLALPGLAGCGSDRNVLNPPASPAENVTAVSATIGAGLDGFIAGNFFGFDIVAPAVRADVCGPIDDACTSGSAEVCFNASTDVSFTDCVNEGNLLNGSISFTNNGPNTTVAYDVTVNGVAMFGNVIAEFNGTCVLQTISTLTMNGPGMSTITDGQLMFCDGDSWPSGTLNVAAQNGSANLLVQFSFDTTETAAVVITEQSTQLSTGCNVNLVTGEAVCSLPG